MAGKGIGAGAAAPVRSRPWTRFLLPTYVFVVMAYTLVPIAVMVLYTFNKAPNQRLTFAWQGFTTEWYGKLFEVADLTQALVHSLEVATISSIIVKPAWRDFMTGSFPGIRIEAVGSGCAMAAPVPWCR